MIKLEGSDTVGGNYFGNSVAISGTTAVVGAPWQDNGVGRAYVFTKTAAGWKQTAEFGKSIPTNGVKYLFGWSVAISGNTIVVGADPGFGTQTYVFTKTATSWKQAAILEGPDIAPEEGDVAGSSLAISGSTLVVGDLWHAQAYVFTDTAGGWSKPIKLKGLDTTAESDFGYTVAISGSTIIIGAGEQALSTGRAYVFTKTAASWRQTAELKEPVATIDDEFGTSVAISGNTAVVGTPGYTQDGAGRGYIFTDTTAGWKLTADIDGTDTAAGDQFGSSLAISGSTIVVGARGASSSAGAVYVFTKTAAGWKQTTEQQDPVANGPAHFGLSVAISGSTVAAGAPWYNREAGLAYLFQI
jgi:hypothetical protein